MTTITEDVKPSEDKPEAGTFRTILPQIIASTIKNVLLLILGLAMAFPTIVIPALTHVSTNVDETETLTLTPVQASWLGSIPYICQPVGSVLSGWLTEPIGRKKTMILVNIPYILAWSCLYFASSLEMILIATVLMGLGTGFMEAPILTYVGEICQPSIRGILTACAGASVMIGITIVYLLGTIMVWRTIALICVTIPIGTMIAICFVPETPMWLLSKNRKEEALTSLRWLRGWVSAEAVQTEFEDIVRYSEFSVKCANCQKKQLKCNHPPPTIAEKFKELFRKRTLKPFTIVMILFVFSQFSGLHAMRPYMVQILKAFRIPVDPGWATFNIGLLGLIANIVCMIFIKLVGKRRIALFSMIGTLSCCMALGLYAYNNLPHDLTSFDIPKYEYGHEDAYPMVVFFLLSFFTSIGVTTIPWMLMGEVFPFKSRGFATGITAALNYIITFIATKTYLNLEIGLGIYGVIWFYGVIDIFGLLFIYFMLPETENRSLEDIETHFSDNSRKLTTVKIQKSQSVSASLVQVEKNTYGIETIPKDVKFTKDGCDNRAYIE